MKTMKKVFAYFLMMLILFGACSAYAETTNSKVVSDIRAKLVIQNFGGDAEKKTNAEMIAKFNEMYPNVVVEDNYTPFSTWSEYINVMLTRRAAGTPADLVYIGGEGVMLSAAKGMVRPLTELIQNDIDENFAAMLTDVNPTLLDCMSYDGEIYYMPTGHNGKALLYNKELFDKAGVPYPTDDWTWDDFIEAAKKLTFVDENGEQIYGYSLQFMTWCFDMWPMIFGSEGPLKNHWSESNLDDPLVAEAYHYIYDMVYTHKICPVPEAGTSATNLFASGRVAMITEGSMFRRSAMGSDILNHLGIAKVPMAPDGSGRRVAIYGPLGWGISSDCENPELAWELLKLFASEERQEALVMAGGATPISRSVAMKALVTDEGDYSLWYDYIEDGMPMCCPVNFTEYDKIMQDCVAAFMSNSMTIEEALANAHEELQEALQY